VSLVDGMIFKRPIDDSIRKTARRKPHYCSSNNKSLCYYENIRIDPILENELGRGDYIDGVKNNYFWLSRLQSRFSLLMGYH